MRAWQAVLLSSALLLFLLSFNVLNGNSAAPPARDKDTEEGSVMSAQQLSARIQDLRAKMKEAAAREDFDTAKALKAEVDRVLRARTGVESAALIAERHGLHGVAAPAGNPRWAEPETRPSAPTTLSAPAQETLQGCLITAWDSVWLMFRNRTRAFISKPTPGCVAKARPADVLMVHKNEGPGRTYTLGSQASAMACARAGCSEADINGGPPRMKGPEGECVRAALGARPVAVEPAGPVQLAGEDSAHLSADLVKQFASPEGQIIVTFVNAHYMDFAVTWVTHLRRAGCNHFLIGALDAEALKLLQARGYQAFSMAEGGVRARDLGWGSQEFKKAQQVKVKMFEDVLRLGYDVLLADIDAVFLRNPLPYLRCFPDADILVSSDHLHNSTTDGGLELSTSAGATMNVGILYVRARPGPVDMVANWSTQCSQNLNFWEQAIFNSLAKDDRGLDVNDRTLAPRRLFRMHERKLVGGILPVSLFCSGHTGFVQRMSEQLGYHPPYALHATFQYSGTRGKKHRFREAMVWEDAAGYYDAPQGFLRYQPVLDPELTAGPWVGVKDTPRHLRLVQVQMAAVRDALALALALGRLLIMPRLVCGYDRYWAGMPEGKIPGSALELPIWKCPMDHLFELQSLPPPEDILREFSFLDNPRTPRSVKENVVPVTMMECSGSPADVLRDRGVNLSARCALDAGTGPPRQPLTE